MWILVRCLGIAGLITSIIPFQFNQHKHIVLCKMLSTFCFATQYFALGAYTAAWMDLVTSLRNYLFYWFVDRKKSTVPVMIAFSLLLCTITAATWAGPLSLIPLLAKIISTVSYGMKNERLLRFITLPSCILWVIYNCTVGGYEAALGDILTFTSILIAIYKFDIRKPKEETSAS